MPFDLIKHLPKPGNRFVLPALAGSSDAYALAVAGLAFKAEKRDPDRHRGQCQRWPAPARRNRLVRRRQAGLPPAAGLGNAALRRLLAAPGPGVRTPGDAARDPQRRTATCWWCRPPPRWCAWRRRRSWPPTPSSSARAKSSTKRRLKAQLTLAGYSHVSQVMSPGEYSVRGGLIDLFPMGSALPYRLDLFGDEIETIRTFDADTQRSLYPVREVRLLPGREFPMDEAARTAFAAAGASASKATRRARRSTRTSAAASPRPASSTTCRCSSTTTATLFDYLPDDAPLALVGDIDGAIARFWTDTESRYRFLKSDRDRPLLEPRELFLSSRAVLHLRQARTGAGTSRATRWHGGVRTVRADSRHRRQPPPGRPAGEPARVLVADRRARDDLRRIDRPARNAAAVFQRIPASTWSRSKASRACAPASARLALGVAPLQAGFELIEAASGHLVFITETELYAGSGRRAGKKKQEATSQVESMVRDLSELKIGDPVVHINHGIGRYMGLDLAWTWAKARPSSCTSNTRRTPSCTCRCRSCT